MPYTSIRKIYSGLFHNHQLQLKFLDDSRCYKSPCKYMRTRQPNKRIFGQLSESSRVHQNKYKAKLHDGFCFPYMHYHTTASNLSDYCVKSNNEVVEQNKVSDIQCTKLNEAEKLDESLQEVKGQMKFKSEAEETISSEKRDVLLMKNGNPEIKSDEDSVRELQLERVVQAFCSHINQVEANKLMVSRPVSFFGSVAPKRRISTNLCEVRMSKKDDQKGISEACKQKAHEDDDKPKSFLNCKIKTAGPCPMPGSDHHRGGKPISNPYWDNKAKVHSPCNMPRKNKNKKQ